MHQNRIRSYLSHCRLTALGLGLFLLLGSGPPPAAQTQTPAKLTRGVWYISFDREGYLSASVPQDLQQIQSRLCPDYIQLTVAVYQSKRDSSDPRIDPARTFSDLALGRVIREVHRLGMKASLLVVLFVDDGTWQGAIQPANVNAWFDAWTKILTHYAELARELNLATLLIGSELETLRDRSDQWNRVIGEVRRRYRGQVMYSTNFWHSRSAYDQVLRMRQWAQLDAVGVTAYFELTHQTDASVAELEAAWRSDRHGQNIVADLQTLSARHQKPLHFWEIGYQSRDGTTIFPWDYRIASPVDEEEQARAYQALLNVFGRLSWFRGYGLYTQAVGLPKDATGYDILGKAAESVLAAACPR